MKKINEILDGLFDQSKCDICGNKVMFIIGEPGDIYQVSFCEDHFEMDSWMAYEEIKFRLWRARQEDLKNDR